MSTQQWKKEQSKEISTLTSLPSSKAKEVTRAVQSRTTSESSLTAVVNTKEPKEIGSNFTTVGESQDTVLTYGSDQKEFQFSTMSEGGVDLDWLLLDNQSTIDVFANSRLLKNIRESGRTLKIHSNGVHSVFSQVGYLKNYGEV